jgi:hypothetical protein
MRLRCLDVFHIDPVGSRGFVVFRVYVCSFHCSFCERFEKRFDTIMYVHLISESLPIFVQNSSEVLYHVFMLILFVAIRCLPSCQCLEGVYRRLCFEFPFLFLCVLSLFPFWWRLVYFCSFKHLLKSSFLRVALVPWRASSWDFRIWERRVWRWL